MIRNSESLKGKKTRIRRELMLALLVAVALPLDAQTPATQTITVPGHVINMLPNATRLPHTQEMDDEQIKVTVVLNLSDPAGAAALKEEMRDPGSANFHRTLSLSEYTSRFGPTQEAYDSVLAYLEQNGLTLSTGSDNRRTLTMKGTRAQAQKAFRVSIDNYQLGSRTFHAIASDPALPTTIAPLVVSVFGLSNLAQMHPNSLPQPFTPMAASFAYDGVLTPAGKTNSSGLPPGLNGSGQNLGLLEFDGYETSDVKNWLTFANLPSDRINHLSNVAIEGGQTPSGCTQSSAKCGTTEALLDIEAAMGVAQGANVIVYTASSGTDLAEAINLAGNYMTYTGGALSVSWSSCEGDVSPSDATGIDSIVYDDEFFGVTVFTGSGDTGSTCTDPDGTYPNTVAFPADASNVVAVGGSVLNTNPDGSYLSESWWTGGGFGISQYVSRPLFQSKLAPKAAGRSVPDVAIESVPGIIVCQAQAGASPNCGDSTTSGGITVFHTFIGGTSLSSPLFAATWTIANQAVKDANGYILSAGGGYLYGFEPGFHAASSFIGTGNNFAHVGLGSPDITKLIAKMVPPKVDSYSPYNGPASGGTKITIVGSGFIGVEKVTFGGVAGTHLTIDSDTKLTVETPEAPSEFATIKVETPGGTATAAGPYTYNPEITKVSPSSGPMQGGVSVTLTGLALSSSDETFLFGDDKATSVSCPTSKECTMLTPAHAPGIVAVEATTPWGYGYSPITSATRYTYDTVAITSFTPGFGPTAGGEFLQLYGNSLGLGHGTKVSFGGVDATGVDCPDPSYCYMSTPAHAAGMVPVTVTVSGLTSPPAKTQFKFEIFPTITGISPTSAAPGSTVTLTGTAFSTVPGQTSFSFFGVSAAGACSSTTQCTAIVPAVNIPLGNPRITSVYVTVNGVTSLDSVTFGYPGKTPPPPCKGPKCS